MGCISMFGNYKKNKVKVILPDNARCDKCGRRIRKGDKFLYMDDKLYCRRCGEAKRDWDAFINGVWFED